LFIQQRPHPPPPSRPTPATARPVAAARAVASSPHRRRRPSLHPRLASAGGGRLARVAVARLQAGVRRAQRPPQLRLRFLLFF